MALLAYLPTFYTISDFSMLTCYTLISIVNSLVGEKYTCTNSLGRALNSEFANASFAYSPPNQMLHISTTKLVPAYGISYRKNVKTLSSLFPHMQIR